MSIESAKSLTEAEIDPKLPCATGRYRELKIEWFDIIVIASERKRGEREIQPSFPSCARGSELTGQRKQTRRSPQC